MNAIVEENQKYESVFTQQNEDDSEFDRLINGSINQLIFSNSRMDRMMRMAELLAKGKVTVPVHLQNNIGDCMAIVLQSAQWNMDPFAVSQKTHIVSGKLAYEAQLVNAVIITRAPVTGRPQYEWFGDWSRVIGKFAEKVSQKGETYRVPGWKLDDEKGIGVRVWMTMRGEKEPRLLELLLTQATVRNSSLWAGDPKQQLAYLAIKRWARLYCPDVLLGVYSIDELEEAPESTSASELPPTTSNTDVVKSKLLALRHRVAVAESLQKAGAIPPDPLPPMDSETGEILEAAPQSETAPDNDPIADLVLAISECKTREELEQHRAAVAALKNGLKKRAVEAWKAVEKRLPA